MSGTVSNDFKLMMKVLVGGAKMESLGNEARNNKAFVCKSYEAMEVCKKTSKCRFSVNRSRECVFRTRYFDVEEGSLPSFSNLEVKRMFGCCRLRKSRKRGSCSKQLKMRKNFLYASPE